MESTERSLPLTLEDLEELPENEYRYELECGVLLREPRPGALHAIVAIRLGSLLHAHASATRGAGVLAEADFVLARDPDTVLCPDVAVLRAERLRALQDPQRPIPGAPDMAIEILSPSNRRGEMRAKIADYLSAGTELVWVVDPVAETVTTYRSLLAPRILRGEDTLDGGSVLPGLEIRCAQLFGWPWGSE